MASNTRSGVARINFHEPGYSRWLPANKYSLTRHSASNAIHKIPSDTADHCANLPQLLLTRLVPTKYLLSTFSRCHAEIRQKGEKRRFPGSRLTGLCSQHPPETRHQLLLSGEMIKMQVTKEPRCVSTTARASTDVRGGLRASCSLTSKSCCFPDAFILMVDMRSAKTVSVDCRASCPAGSDSGDPDTSSWAREDWSSLISS